MNCIHYGSNEFDPKRFKPIKNYEYPFIKPFFGTGLWASPVDSKYGWKDWCNDAKFSYDFSCYFTFDLVGSVLTINSKKDMLDLPVLEFPQKLHIKTKGFDFELISKDYDAIHLTFKGLVATNVITLGEPSLYGWDCESVLVLNKKAIKL